MSNIKETTNHVHFHLVPEAEKGSHRTADASSAISILNNLLQKLAQSNNQQGEQSHQHDLKDQVNKHLGNLVNSVEDMIHQTNAPPELGKQLLLELLLAVQQVQEVQSETTMVSSEAESKGSEAATQNAAEQYKQVLQDVQEQEDQPWWKKALDIVVKVVVPVVMIAVGVLTAQPELVMAGALVAVMSDTPLMSDLTQGFEDLLTDIGIPKSDAEWIAGFMTVATVAITTAGVGAIGAVEVGADEAVEAVADVGEKALTDIAEDATEAKKGTKISLNSRKVSKACLTGAAMAMSSEAPTISEGIFDSIPISNPEVKKVLQSLTTVLLELTAAVGLVATGFVSTASEAGSSSAVSKGIEKLTKGVSELVSNNMPDLVDFVSETAAKIADEAPEELVKVMEKLADKAPTAKTIARLMKVGAAGANGAADFGNGIYSEEQANIVDNMGESQAELSMDMAASRIGESSTKTALNFTKNMNKSLTQILNSISHFGYVGSAAAQTIANNI